ncbi:oligopeptide transporter, OPT family, partial [bacterium]|nr:oligopeptide transporter, OPT family [bacterium]
MTEQTRTNGDNFIPYVTHDKKLPESTLQAYVLGIILGMVFAAANAYLGLYVGMTVSASIPAAVISMAILRQIMKRGTILENNIVQTIASTGESLAAGVIFTIPAFFIWHATRPDIAIPSLLKIGYLILLGGILGTLGMIPLRRYLIKREHGILPYPEGTACAEVLIAGEKGGAQAKKVLWGVLTGGIYKLALGLGIWTKDLIWQLSAPKRAYFGVDAIPALLGVGYILGPRTSAVLLAGGALGSLVLVPVIAFFGAETTHAIFPSTRELISAMTGEDIHSVYVRYIGAGAVTMGGILSLLKILPALGKSLFSGLRGLGQKKIEKSSEQVRTDRDLPNWFVVGGSILVALLVWIMTPATPLIAALVIVFGFIFILVSSRIVGIVGSSSNPVSGMTIATLLGTALLFVNIGFIGVSGMVAALMVGAVVCIAVCAAGDMSQDLKTGFLVGATPWKQQVAEFAGVLSAAIIVGAVV